MPFPSGHRLAEVKWGGSLLGDSEVTSQEQLPDFFYFLPTALPSPEFPRVASSKTCIAQGVGPAY